MNWTNRGNAMANLTINGKSINVDVENDVSIRSGPRRHHSRGQGAEADVMLPDGSARWTHAIPRQQFVEFLDGMFGDAGQDVGEPGLRIDVVHLGGLCCPPNYAERFLMRPIVCPNLWPVERTSPKFHSA